MAKPDGAKGRHAPPKNTPEERNDADFPVEEQPAVDRGERIDAGKTIARGGHETGRVPGAEESR
jgi:hypothetical protein